MSESTKESAGDEKTRTQVLKSYLRFLGIHENELLCFVAVHPRCEEMRRAQTAACFVRVRDAPKALKAAEDIEPVLNAEGLYLMPGKIHPDVAARDLPRSWTAGLEQPKDHEVVKRRVIVVDLDPKRIRGVSSTEEELNLAHDVAQRIHGFLRDVLGSEASLAVACSGNGYHVLLAVDLETGTDGRKMSDPARPLVERLLANLEVLFGTDRVDVDRSVVEARRLFPAYGTWKRKGRDTKERRHRQSTFPSVSERPPRLSFDELRDLVAAVESKLSDEQKKALDGESKASRKTTSPPPEKQESDLDICSRVSMTEVLKALDQNPKWPTCPSCGAGGSKGDTSVKVLAGNGDSEVLKCLHGTCGGWGGGVVKLVARSVAGVDSLKGNKPAIEKVVAWFKDQGLADFPKRKPRPQVPRPEELKLMGYDFDDEAEHEEAVRVRNCPRRNLTDQGNAERLIDTFGDRLRFVPQWGTWLVYDGIRWCRDPKLVQVRPLAVRTVRNLYEEAAREEDADRRVALSRHASSSERKKAISDMISLAEPLAVVDVEKLDSDPYLLNCPNGTVDLKTGQLRPHDPKDYITKVTKVAYDAKASRERVDRFLERCIPDPELLAYLWRLQGYGASGDVGEHILPIHYGSGRNGKGTFLNSIQRVLGDYATQVPTELLMEQRQAGHPTDRATLYQVRFAVAVETEEGKPLAVGLVKQLTGGDPISARRMREDFWTFLPTHLIQLATNHRPIIKETKDAIWDRVHLIPWLVTIPKAERDTGLPEALAKDPGLLRALVEGAVSYAQHGLQVPEAVKAASESYREESDILGEFKDDTLMEGTELWVSSSALYRRYRHWALDSGLRPLSQRRLTLQLDETGIGQQAKNEGRRGRSGIGLKPWDPEPNAFEISYCDDDE